MIFLIFALSVFFAVNMGGSSFGAAFAASYGSRIVRRMPAAVLFVIFVILGSVFLGQHVAVTLGKGIIADDLISRGALVIILVSAGLSMFVANLMKIPQSTSLVTVAAVAGVGTFYQSLNLKTIFYCLPFWLGLPVVAYGLTILLTAGIYPPRKSNLWIYQKFVNQKKALTGFVLFCSCYSAFSVGSNNVANVVGPLLAGLADPQWSVRELLQGLFVFAVFYGSGAFLISGPLRLAGETIVPIGLLTASIISFVSGSLILLASYLGIPQSFVMLQLGAIFAIKSLKEGFRNTFESKETRRTLYTWTINPVLTFFLSLFLSWAFLR